MLQERSIQYGVLVGNREDKVRKRRRPDGRCVCFVRLFVKKIRPGEKSFVCSKTGINVKGIILRSPGCGFGLDFSHGTVKAELGNWENRMSIIEICKSRKMKNALLPFNARKER